MSKLKDKLSANMRTVKANQPQGPAKPAPAKPHAPVAAKPNAPVAAKPAPAPKPNPPATPKIAGDVPNSGTTLFPDRVWPD